MAQSIQIPKVYTFAKYFFARRGDFQYRLDIIPAKYLYYQYAKNFPVGILFFGDFEGILAPKPPDFPKFRKMGGFGWTVPLW